MASPDKRVVHLSAECFPLAKVGGLADVVGSLPKYQRTLGWEASVIMPHYHLPKITGQAWQEVHQDTFHLGDFVLPYRVLALDHEVYGFPIYSIDIPGKFDRPGVYGDPHGHFYGDGPDRFMAFQHTCLKWLSTWEALPDIVHCHDHHTGIVPFLMKYGLGFERFRDTPSIFTVHNGRYHGAYGWDMLYAFPFFDWNVRSLLDWEGAINPLASGIKTAWKVTTVSPTYLEELKNDSQGLEWLFQNESAKSVGILNGIDHEVWNPTSDVMIRTPLKKSITSYKKQNRDELNRVFGLDPARPLVSFIGRFAHEKGADLLPELIHQTFANGIKLNFLVLGSGSPWLHHALHSQKEYHRQHMNTYIGYNEELAHQIYAGSDFLLMPSRVEPCGLNQMYAMRYGSIPIVRRTGGLADSVIDFEDPGGRGIMFSHASIGDLLHALRRAEVLAQKPRKVAALRKEIMQIDFSWEKSASLYINLYQDSLI